MIAAVVAWFTVARAWLAAHRAVDTPAKRIALAVAAVVLGYIALRLCWWRPVQSAAIGMAIVVAGRCCWVINHLNWRDRGRAYLPWLAFGASYALLAVCALGAAVQIVDGRAAAGDWMWLAASCGLIVFDRRKKVAT